MTLVKLRWKSEIKKANKLNGRKRMRIRSKKDVINQCFTTRTCCNSYRFFADWKIFFLVSLVKFNSNKVLFELVLASSIPWTSIDCCEMTELIMYSKTFIAIILCTCFSFTTSSVQNVDRKNFFTAIGTSLTHTKQKSNSFSVSHFTLPLSFSLISPHKIVSD